MSRATRAVFSIVVPCLVLATPSALVASEPAAKSLAVKPPPTQHEVLFGSYSCRVDAGRGVTVEADFSSTGDLVPPPAAGMGEGASRFHIPTLRTENTVLDPDASLESCESLAAHVERFLTSASCTAGDRVISSQGNLIGLRYVCEGRRAALARIIGAVGRAVLRGDP